MLLPQLHLITCIKFRKFQTFSHSNNLKQVKLIKTLEYSENAYNKYNACINNSQHLITYIIQLYEIYHIKAAEFCVGILGDNIYIKAVLKLMKMRIRSCKGIY